MSNSTDGLPKKAYRNLDFLESASARALRILSEYIEPNSRFNHYKIDDTIIFFGSARILPRDEAEKRLEAASAEGGDLKRAERDLDMSRYYEETRELARRLTEWSKGLEDGDRRFVVCSGGGPGIMEAANRGASEARGLNVGLNISLPMEQLDNPYISRELNFEFHYFFMRKFWFAYLAKAVVVMPGGFGTLDELFELLTLVQTGKIRKQMPVVLFGSQYWAEVINLEALERYGTISAEDLELFFRTDSVDEAFDFITEQLQSYALDIPGPRL
ncbi:MAG TPA: LOG family protein [Kiloniellaceae bacterium]|nr:LOG family protein [Kiloniellaceae bacterium]HIP80194.1 LOG family protein [Kiloniellaceae bacterium]